MLIKIVLQYNDNAKGLIHGIRNAIFINHCTNWGRGFDGHPRPARGPLPSTILISILFIKCKEGVRWPPVALPAMQKASEGAREAVASPSVMPPKYNLNYDFVYKM